MGWQMDSHGNWTGSSGTGSTGTNLSGGRTATDKGNTSDTDASINNTTSNKTAKLKYAEEARFETDGDYNIRRGGYLNIGGGIASRWVGSWLILESTHTISSRGYTTEGLVGRIPYYEEDSSNSSGSGKSDSGSSSGSSGGTSSGGSGGGNSGGQWTMDPDGTWHKK